MSSKFWFGGSRFMFWTLAPLLIVFAVAMPFTVIRWTNEAVVAIAVLDMAALLLATGLYNPRRNEWALRMFTGLLFLAYLVYVIFELVETPGSKSLVFFHHVVSLAVVAWFCIKFTLTGFDAEQGE